MMAETEVRTELSDVPKVAMEDKCALDMSSYEDLPKVDGDCNGDGKHADDENLDAAAEGANVNMNVNVNGKDDPDGSYVFVSRCDSTDGEPIDRDLHVECIHESHIIPDPKVGLLNEEVEGKVGEFSVENGETLSVDDNCIADGDATASDDKVINLNLDEDSILENNQNSTTTVEIERKHRDVETKFEEKVTPDSVPDRDETQEFPNKISNVSNCGTPQLDDGKIKSEKQTNLESTAELGEVQESDIFVTENDLASTGKDEPKEQDHIESSPHFRESKEVQAVVLVATDSKSLVLNDDNVSSKEHVDTSETSEPEWSQESEDMVSEASDCKLPQFEVSVATAETQISMDSPDTVVESSESQIIKPNSAESESIRLVDGENKPEEEENIDLRKDMEEKQKSELAVSDNTNSGIHKVNNVAKFANEIDVTVKRESGIANDLDENKGSNPTSNTEDNVLLTNVPNELSTELSGSSENAESLPLSVDCVRPEIVIESKQVEDIPSCPAESAKLETGDADNIVRAGIMTTSNEACSGTDSVPSSIDTEGKVSCTDANVGYEIPNKVTECAHSEPIEVCSLDLPHGTNGSLRNGSGTEVKPESEVENFSCTSEVEMPCNDNNVSHSDVLDGIVLNCESAPTSVPEALNVQDGRDQAGNDGDDYINATCQETDATEQGQKDQISTCSPEGSNVDILDGVSTGMEAVKRPFHFLIKIPRYDDETLREQIRHAQSQVDEKTQQRDAIRANLQMMKANCQQLQNNYEAAKSEDRAARGSVKLKRQEIDSVQTLINRVKNAISVDDIDVRIHNMEHMMQHETLPLKEEKQFIREIKQLKQLRDQLSSNMGSQDEVQQALDQRDQIEERLKILKKELDCLKDKVSKAEAIAEAAGKKYSGETKKLKELHIQFRAADDVRQEAYIHLQNLRRQLYEKNTGFRAYKDVASATNNYASNGDKEAVHRLCVKQVETIIELWKTNDDFRNEYVRCNKRSTLRRFGTLDGRALGPDEEPAVLPALADERNNISISTPGGGHSEIPILAQEEGKEKKISTVKSEETDKKSMAMLAEQVDQASKTRKLGKPSLESGSVTVGGGNETKEMPELEHKITIEQQELARKEEELRKEEAAVKLKEQQRLEEKGKAKEALERKRRNAEKAKIRAELRAQKEAEQKEKEREKRAKKKERKKAAAAEAPDCDTEGETPPASESPPLITKEPDTKEGPLTMTRKPQKLFQFTKQSKTKSIPPPLRNRGKRKMQQWIWIIITVLVVIALFLLGNIGFYSNLGHNLRMRSSGY